MPVVLEAMAEPLCLLRTLALISALLTLGLILWRGVWKGSRRASGRSLGMGARWLRPGLLLSLAVLWTATCVWLWRPLPIRPSATWECAMALAGGAMFFSGLVLYLWGMWALGEMFRPSSGLGVQLDAEQRLVTTGPYARLRHPMYAGLIVLALGGVLLFWNWTMLFLLASFLTLVMRARREERALAMEFGERWRRYRLQVPAWWPHLRS